MGDNGFIFGEHGLIDKRTAYEESMRVPMLVHAPSCSRWPAGRPDGGQPRHRPDVLDAAGLQTPAHMDGRACCRWRAGRAVAQELLYEYYWERNFPQTPTLFALRRDRYKYIHYHGVWDIDELFDLKADPLEMDNLAGKPEFTAIAKEMSDRMFAILEETNGRVIPRCPDRGPGNWARGRSCREWSRLRRSRRP